MDYFFGRLKPLQHIYWEGRHELETQTSGQVKGVPNHWANPLPLQKIIEYYTQGIRRII